MLEVGGGTTPPHPAWQCLCLRVGFFFLSVASGAGHQQSCDPGLLPRYAPSDDCCHTLETILAHRKQNIFLLETETFSKLASVGTRRARSLVSAAC